MREIKFRVWAYQQMIADPGMIAGHFDDHEAPINKRFAEDAKSGDRLWMQFTGLKDKNGVEIYEGDVLRSDLGGECIEYVVQYRAPRFIFMTKHGAWAEDLPSDKNATEVIGNIHENPELLNRSLE